MSTAKPRKGLEFMYIALFLIVITLIIIASGKAREIDTNNAEEANRTAKYDAFIVSVSQEVIAVQEQVGRIDTSAFVTRDELDRQSQQVEAQIRQLIREPNAYCVWSEPDVQGIMTVSCKRG